MAGEVLLVARGIVENERTADGLAYGVSAYPSSGSGWNLGVFSGRHQIAGSGSAEVDVFVPSHAGSRANGEAFLRGPHFSGRSGHLVAHQSGAGHPEHPPLADG